LYIQSISIKNLRCFESAKLNFQYPGREQKGTLRLPNVNLLLGNNGAGKTTVLKAIALASLSGVMIGSGLVPYRLVRRTGKKTDLTSEARVSAEVLLHEQDIGLKSGFQTRSEDIEEVGMSIFSKGDYESFQAVYSAGRRLSGTVWQRLYEDKSPAFLVVGYGASRRVEDSSRVDMNARRKARLLRYERVAGLFESYVSLIPLAVWLPSFQKENPGRYKQVVNLINRLLPDGATFAGEFEQGEYQFEVNGVNVPFGALSDGYRAYIGWIADLLYHICLGAPKGAKLVDNRGIVLVDEIDLHLHPEWQRSVVSTVSKALPNLQFVFTTHSPIVAGSLEKENIFVMETGPDGASVVEQYDEPIYGRSAEQVLLSSYFNLKTTRAEPFVDEMKQLSLKAGEGDLNAALAFMEKLAHPTQTSFGKPASNGTRNRRKADKAGTRKKPVKKAPRTR
jgi:predicted ATPase